MTGTRASCCTRATRLLPPARHDDVQVVGHAGQHVADRGAVGRRHQLDADSAASPPPRRPSTQAGMDGGIGMAALRAAAQDHGVAGFQAQRAGVGGHVGAALVDDADHAQRHPHALDPAGRWAACHSAATVPIGSGSCDDVLDAAGHRLDALPIERQPIEQRACSGARRAPPTCRAHWRRGSSGAGADGRRRGRQRGILRVSCRPAPAPRRPRRHCGPTAPSARRAPRSRSRGSRVSFRRPPWRPAPD